MFIISKLCKLKKRKHVTNKTQSETTVPQMLGCSEQFDELRVTLTSYFRISQSNLINYPRYY